MYLPRLDVYVCTLYASMVLDDSMGYNCETTLCLFLSILIC